MKFKKNRTAGLSFSIISYNLSFHRAASELKDLVRKHKPDILCLQECRTQELPAFFDKLEVAGLTAIGEQGLALYINSERFKLESVDHPRLRRAFLRWIIPEPRQRLLVAKMYDKMTKKSLVIANFHATHLIATNYHRRVETKAALHALKEYGQKIPSVLIGDYNYPILTKGLKKLVERTGYSFAKPQSITYKGFGVKDYFDFASYANLAAKEIESLPFGKSDHAPIIITFGQ